MNTYQVTPDQVADLDQNAQFQQFYSVLQQAPVPYPSWSPSESLAYAFIGEQVLSAGTTGDIRSLYKGDATSLNTLNNEIDQLMPTSGQGFTEADFESVQQELLKETNVVATVADFFGDLTEMATTTFFLEKSGSDDVVQSLGLKDQPASSLTAFFSHIIEGVVNTIIGAIPGVGGILAAGLSTIEREVEDGLKFTGPQPADRFESTVSELNEKLTAGMTLLVNNLSDVWRSCVTDWGKAQSMRQLIKGNGGNSVLFLDGPSQGPAALRAMAAYQLEVAKILLPIQNAVYYGYYYPDEGKMLYIKDGNAVIDSESFQFGQYVPRHTLSEGPNIKGVYRTYWIADKSDSTKTLDSLTITNLMADSTGWWAGENGWNLVTCAFGSHNFFDITVVNATETPVVFKYAWLEGAPIYNAPSNTAYGPNEGFFLGAVSTNSLNNAKVGVQADISQGGDTWTATEVAELHWTGLTNGTVDVSAPLIDPRSTIPNAFQFQVYSQESIYGSAGGGVLIKVVASEDA